MFSHLLLSLKSSRLVTKQSTKQSVSMEENKQARTKYYAPQYQCASAYGTNELWYMRTAVLLGFSTLISSLLQVTLISTTVVPNLIFNIIPQYETHTPYTAVDKNWPIVGKKSVEAANCAPGHNDPRPSYVLGERHYLLLTSLSSAQCRGATALCWPSRASLKSR